MKSMEPSEDEPEYDLRSGQRDNGATQRKTLTGRTAHFKPALQFLSPLHGRPRWCPPRTWGFVGIDYGTIDRPVAFVSLEMNYRDIEKRLLRAARTDGSYTRKADGTIAISRIDFHAESLRKALNLYDVELEPPPAAVNRGRVIRLAQMAPPGWQPTS